MVDSPPITEASQTFILEEQCDFCSGRGVMPNATDETCIYCGGAKSIPTPLGNKVIALVAKRFAFGIKDFTV